MKYFLIDYENVGENGLKGIQELDGDCCVVIFYSENADKISFDMHQKLTKCRAKLDFRKISIGKKNALDFQLSTYLGFLVAQCGNDQFYIVSKDNGYRAVLDFWKDKKVRQIDFVGRTTARPLMLEAKPAESAKQPEAAQPEAAQPAKPETKQEPAEAEKQPEAVKPAGVKKPEAEEKQPEQAQQPVEAETAKPAENAAASEPEKTERRPRRGRHGRRRGQESRQQEANAALNAPADMEKAELSEILDGGTGRTQETARMQEEELPFTDLPEEGKEQAAAAPQASAGEPDSEQPAPETEAEASADAGKEENAPAAARPEEKPSLAEAAKEEPSAETGAAKGEPSAEAGAPAEPKKKPHRGGRKKKAAEPQPDEFAPDEELKAQVAQVIEEPEAREQIGRFIVKYKTKQGVNNAIVKLYGTEKAGELYKKIKPLLKDKKGK